MKTNITKLSIGAIALLFISTNLLATPTAAPKTYPDGELGRMVKLGEDILNRYPSIDQRPCWRQNSV